jgi:predicted DCC family thiol-disulfide oxidoreductase YuxK
MTDVEVEVFYDGQCPPCRREMRMLRRRDKRQRIRFVDIMAPDFDSHALGRTQEALMSRIHARLADGTIVEGVEVFRRLYAALGSSRLVALSRLPGLAPLLDLGYRWFARNRLRLTGRCADNACAIAARSTRV